MAKRRRPRGKRCAAAKRARTEAAESAASRSAAPHYEYAVGSAPHYEYVVGCVLEELLRAVEAVDDLLPAPEEAPPPAPINASTTVKMYRRKFHRRPTVPCAGPGEQNGECPAQCDCTPTPWPECDPTPRCGDGDGAAASQRTHRRAA
jgi:hypothetical protein